MALNPEIVPATLAVADVGGTNCRFSLARVAPGLAPALVGGVTTIHTADHASFAAAWQSWVESLPERPQAASIAIATFIAGDALKLTNNPWVIRPSTLANDLGVGQLLLLNDFGAITHAVGRLGAGDLAHLCGPDTGIPAQGVVSVVGPGTGLGVGYLLRRNGHVHVVETEGGHADFAPVDPIEDQLLARLRARLIRVSVERVCAGPGLARIHEALAIAEGRPVTLLEDRALWDGAIAGSNPLAAAALERFCLALGTACGDYALAHGAAGVVLAGGLPPRFLPQLRASGFAGRFRAKGRFETLMAALPVYVCTHPQPGLLGAAAAFMGGDRTG